jgi:L-ascorbate metabolism protein UlaG (beta-lactamase superfamily)
LDFGSRIWVLWMKSTSTSTANIGLASGKGKCDLRCTLDWAGCSTFRLVCDDKVVFLDAYLDRVGSADQSGLKTKDVKCADWILIGHSHFDHLWGAQEIAMNTGAKIVGSYETVRIMAALGVEDSQLLAVAGGERIRLGKNLVVSVYPSLHSCVWAHSKMPDVDEVCLGDLGLLWHEREERRAELVNYLGKLGPETSEHLRETRLRERGDGGALVYLLQTPGGSILFQDSSGSWSTMFGGLRPNVAILAAAGRGNVDGEPFQGSLTEFVVSEVDLLGPDRVILCHHDNWLPGFSSPTDPEPIRRAMATRSPSASLLDLEYVSEYPLF